MSVITKADGTLFWSMGKPNRGSVVSGLSRKWGVYQCLVQAFTQVAMGWIVLLASVPEKVILNRLEVER